MDIKIEIKSLVLMKTLKYTLRNWHIDRLKIK